MECPPCNRWIFITSSECQRAPIARGQINCTKFFVKAVSNIFWEGRYFLTLPPPRLLPSSPRIMRKMRNKFYLSVKIRYFWNAKPTFFRVQGQEPYFDISLFSPHKYEMDGEHHCIRSQSLEIKPLARLLELSWQPGSSRNPCPMCHPGHPGRPKRQGLGPQHGAESKEAAWAARSSNASMAASQALFVLPKHKKNSARTAMNSKMWGYGTFGRMILHEEWEI